MLCYVMEDHSLVAYAVAAAAKSLQLCPTLRLHRWQPTRLLHPWDSPGKNTGVGCHFLLHWWLINEGNLLLTVLEVGGQRSGAKMLGSCEGPLLDVSSCFLSLSSCNRKKER